MHSVHEIPDNVGAIMGFAHTLPRKDTETHVNVATVDIGTNTVLLLIAEIDPSGHITPLAYEQRIPRLGKGVDVHRELQQESMQRVIHVLLEYRQIMSGYNLDVVVVFGTSAVRDAVNKSQFADLIVRNVGFELEILSGDEEARWTYRGALSGVPEMGKATVVDIGGGSTEITLGNRDRIEKRISLDIGSVRLTERFLHSDPVGEAECASMITAIDQQLTSIRERFSDALPALVLVGIAGTFTTLAAVEKQLTRYSHSAVHGACLTLSEVRRQVRLFQSKTIAERKKIPGLEAKRADVILAGAYLTERIMTAFGAERIMVSDQGVRYGLLHERLASL